MPKRDDAPIGAPCWVDLLTTDPDRSRDFYGRLFGWTVEDPGEDYGGYVNFLSDGIHVAGCMRNDGTAGVPDLWSVYLATDDAEATVARGRRARRAGDGAGDGRHGARAHGGRRRRRRRGDRHVAAGSAPRLRHLRRTRDAGVVRAAHARLRRVDRLLPRRVRLEHAGRERHARVPLHDPRRRRRAARRA